MEPIQVNYDSPWDKVEAWPAQPTLQVTLAPGAARSREEGGRHYHSRRSDSGEFVVELDDDTVVDVGLFGGVLPWTTRRVVVPPGTGRVDVELTLPEATPSGTLQLDVVGDAGAVLVDGVRVRVVHPDSGVVLIDRACDSTKAKDWPLALSLPEGGYLLLVEGHPWVNLNHGTLMRERLHGGFEAPVHIAAGAVAPVRARTCSRGSSSVTRTLPSCWYRATTRWWCARSGAGRRAHRSTCRPGQPCRSR